MILTFAQKVVADNHDQNIVDKAKEINKNMKRDDTHINILSQLGVLAEDVGLQLDSYQESKVLQLHNQLESACYELEEVFEDAIRDVQNKLEELGVEY